MTEYCVFVLQVESSFCLNWERIRPFCPAFPGFSSVLQNGNSFLFVFLHKNIISYKIIISKWVCAQCWQDVVGLSYFISSKVTKWTLKFYANFHPPNCNHHARCFCHCERLQHHQQSNAVVCWFRTCCHKTETKTINTHFTS